MADTTKSTFENVNDLIKSLAWPSIVLLAFLSYRAEFNQIIELIPNKLESSSKISIGSLSFEIEKTAKASGNAQLGKLIKNLSENEIRKLLTLGESRQSLIFRSTDAGKKEVYELPTDVNILISLDKRGLIKSEKPVEDFVNFFKSLHPNERTLYKLKDGYATSKIEPSATPYTEYTIPILSLSDKDKEKVDDFTIELSNSGKKSFGIIVHVTAEQIKDN